LDSRPGHSLSTIFCALKTMVERKMKKRLDSTAEIWRGIHIRSIDGRKRELLGCKPGTTERAQLKSDRDFYSTQRL
jgi:hypothetical protein